MKFRYIVCMSGLAGSAFGCESPRIDIAALSLLADSALRARELSTSASDLLLMAPATRASSKRMPAPACQPLVSERGAAVAIKKARCVDIVPRLDTESLRKIVEGRHAASNYLHVRIPVASAFDGGLRAGASPCACDTAALPAAARRDAIRVKLIVCYKEHESAPQPTAHTVLLGCAECSDAALAQRIQAFVLSDVGRLTRWFLCAAPLCARLSDDKSTLYLSYDRYNPVQPSPQETSFFVWCLATFQAANNAADDRVPDLTPFYIERMTSSLPKYLFEVVKKYVGEIVTGCSAPYVLGMPRP